MKNFLNKNILVIGSTGSGRSNFIDKLITSYLIENNPEDCKLLLIDPKKVNFGQYDGIAHLLSDVISSPSKAKSAFKWGWGESLRRLKAVENLGVDSVYEYKHDKEFRNNFPEIIIIIEELTDFIVSDKKFFEDYIKKITALSDITGIYIVAATARSIPDVVTKKIRSSFLERVAFRLSTKEESVLAICEDGAEKLDKAGLCLVKNLIDLKTQKIQMPYISEKEIVEAVELIKEKYSDFQILMNAKDSAEEKAEDILYAEAMKAVVENGKASPALLQRKLQIGYSRAARLMDILEENGVIGEADGAKPREILIQK